LFIHHHWSLFDRTIYNSFQPFHSWIKKLHKIMQILKNIVITINNYKFTLLEHLPFSYVIVVTHTGSVPTLVPIDAFWHDFEIMSNCHGIWHTYSVVSLIKTLWWYWNHLKKEMKLATF
jgi:hypothetical protein